MNRIDDRQTRPGLGRPLPWVMTAVLAMSLSTQASAADVRRANIEANPPWLNKVVPSGPNAAAQGVFGPVIQWPSVPIHLVLTPDGRVMAFGATSTGKQGGQLDYSVWDPELGTGADAFLLLDNTTEVNLFCAGQWLLPSSGKVLITGGTRIEGGVRGIGIADVTIFSPKTDTIAKTTSMAYRRWYATTVGTLSGEVVALGGRIDPEANGNEATYASIPEVYDPKTRAWRVLTGAQSDIAYGAANYSWYYPRAYPAPDGNTFIMTHTGAMYSLSTAGTGLLTKFDATTADENSLMPSAVYAPGKIITVRDATVVDLVDINGATPVVTHANPISIQRKYGNGTLLPNGKFFVNGGNSLSENTIEGAVFGSETWDPVTGLWTPTATATIPRLYHSSALLLPDASVLTGGGGLPGPLTNNNAEIYYPPYFYKKNGSPAPRPAINTQPVSLGWDQPFSVKINRAPKPISRVTLLGTGQVTHAFNNGQRFQELPFAIVDNKLELRTPASKTLTPAGYYLLFALDAEGVPSVGKIIRINE